MDEPYEYMKNQIINTPIQYFPYPHIHLDGIFPKSFYEKIIKNIPEIKEFTPKPKYPGRKTSTLDDYNNLPEEKKQFWIQIDKWLKSEDFSKLLLHKFSIDQEGHSDYFLHKDLEDFEVTPHKDVHSKLVTYIFYLPKDDSMSELGTQILVPKSGLSIPDTTAHQKWEHFELVKIIENIPNSFFAFAPCENSYHAVKIKFPTNQVKKERDTLRGFVFDVSEKDYPYYLFGKKN